MRSCCILLHVCVHGCVFVSKRFQAELSVSVCHCLISKYQKRSSVPAEHTDIHTHTLLFLCLTLFRCVLVISESRQSAKYLMIISSSHSNNDAFFPLMIFSLSQWRAEQMKASLLAHSLASITALLNSSPSCHYHRLFIFDSITHAGAVRDSVTHTHMQEVTIFLNTATCEQSLRFSFALISPHQGGVDFSLYPKRIIETQIEAEESSELRIVGREGRRADGRMAGYMCEKYINLPLVIFARVILMLSW